MARPQSRPLSVLALLLVLAGSADAATPQQTAPASEPAVSTAVATPRADTRIDERIVVAGLVLMPSRDGVELWDATGRVAEIATDGPSFRGRDTRLTIWRRAGEPVDVQPPVRSTDQASASGLAASDARQPPFGAGTFDELGLPGPELIFDGALLIEDGEARHLTLVLLRDGEIAALRQTRPQSDGARAAASGPGSGSCTKKAFTWCWKSKCYRVVRIDCPGFSAVQIYVYTKKLKTVAIAKTKNKAPKPK